MDFATQFKKLPEPTRIKLILEVIDAIDVQIKINRQPLVAYLESAESRQELLVKIVNKTFEEKAGSIESILNSIISTNS